MQLFRLLLIFFIIGLAPKMNAQITLDKIWGSYQYLPESVPGFNFMNDGVHYSRLENNQINKYDLTTGEKIELILDGQKLAETGLFDGKISSYNFSGDEKYIIIENSKEKIYRRSSKAYFFIYNRATENLSAVKAGQKISYATISPNGKHVAYVFENNIYIQNLESNSTIQLTRDGEYNKIINGATDWVYEEEFAFAKAFFWNATGTQLAYLRFDESEVNEFTMTNYRDDLYPEYVTFKYPKVGEQNSVVSAHVYHLNNNQTHDIETGEEEDIYLPRLKWTNDENTLFVYRLNRHQNHLEVLSTNTLTGESTKVIDEKNKYYIDITDDIQFLKNSDQFIWSSEKSGFNHLYLYNLNGQEINALTSGNYDVTHFYGVDEVHNIAYYQAAEDSPLERQVYCVKLNGKSKKLITDFKGSNQAQFSSTFDYYVNTHSTINEPASYKVYNRKGKLIRTLEDNKELKNVQQNEEVQNVQFFEFNNTSGERLNGYMIKPPNMEAGKKYPVMMYVYGGPGSQNVTNAWKGQNYWWFQMLAQNGYVVACVDNRGTGARGEEFKKITYQQLGYYETLDQTDAAKYLGSLPFTDEKRIGIFGWSYGGYMSSLCLLKSNDVFKAAIAVAPVTNWKWYDTIYTERYMRTVDENPDGYANNAPVNLADRLKGEYLLIHGLGDDNVHFQHTAEMANALIMANKQFDTYFYPNRNHSIAGGVTRLHLYNKMTDFIYNKL